MTNLLERLFDMVSPRACPICGRRLATTEKLICGTCNLALPRTGYQLMPLDNELARVFWGRIPIERCSAFFFYKPHSPSSNLIYRLKYFDHPEIGYKLGQLLAQEYLPTGFFEGIDAIIPMPLAPKRIRQRGYNQSIEIARGISRATHLPVIADALARHSFHGSQTSKDRWQRNENVRNEFELRRQFAISYFHLLLVDDVITTGATMTAAAQELLKAPGVSLSLIALGYAKG